MAKPRIEILNSFEYIPFGAKKEDVRNILQDPYVNSNESLPSKEEVEPAMKIVEEKIKELFEVMGRDPDSFEWPETPVSDVDRYESFWLEYNDKTELVAATVFPEKCEGMIINGREFNGFKIKELLTLADDFVWEKLDTSYTSYSKQIAIYCPEGKNKIENIMFGCPGYFEPAQE
ncbi:MAG: hypothetical protein K6G52_02780 [Treponemataceae bacterium]|nr:hypothetical protein [Treponemataceae bacterium]